MNWQEIVITVISAIVTALASWVVSKITTYINTKVNDTKLKRYLNSAVTVVASAVKQTYQTYVENIKGTDFWTEDAQKNALSAALETAKEQLSGDVQKYIQSNFGDLDKWIITQIEAAIYDLKNKPSEATNASA